MIGIAVGKVQATAESLVADFGGTADAYRAVAEACVMVGVTLLLAMDNADAAMASMARAIASAQKERRRQ